MNDRTNELFGCGNEEAVRIYGELASHQRSEAWFARDINARLQEWGERFNLQFKLEIPEFVLRIDMLRRRILGHFRYGHNGFGLKGEIGINLRYLVADRPEYDVLGTLLHEQLHAWQQAHGTPGSGNYHNKQFREKAESLGLIIDQRGVQQYAPPPSPFFDLLSQHAVEVPKFEFISPVKKLQGESKMKKWSCGCTNVRCAIAEFRAVCLKCGNPFIRAS